MSRAERLRHRYAVAAATLIATGLVWRLAPLGLPAFLLKYGKSILWGAMVYCLVGAAAPGLPFRKIALIAGLIALGAECFRLVHAPWLDAFRMTLPGALLLGRIFSLWNLFAYAVGILVVAYGDRFLLMRRAGAHRALTNQ